LSLLITPVLRAVRHLLLLGVAGWTLAAAQTVPPEEKPLALPKFEVSEHAEDDEFDATGMGSVEEELRSSPFANDLTAVDFAVEEGLSGDVGAELSAISSVSPASAAAGEERLNLRGFPTPVLRNSFTRMGILETLNVSKTIVIQGPLVPVLGRAAPGGIQDFLTTRPAAKGRNRLEAGASTANRRRLTWESTGALIAKKLWQRWAVDWSHKTGPEQFVRENDLAVSGALTWRHSRAASSLVSVDYRRYDGTPTPGIPEFKTAAGQQVMGPYLPLAHFNANGPGGGVFRESLVVGAQFESQLNRAVALRAALEGWWRAIDQQRFTTSQLLLSTGLFEGTREPRHIAQRQRALAAHLELTGRFRTGTVEHKLLGYAGMTWGRYDRNDRALTTADRNALPESVRRFNPAAPDYFFPPFDPALYTRLLTDRFEAARYTSLEVSDRLAFDRGRTVVTAGLRLDEVDLKVEDLRAGASVPNTNDRTAQLSYHTGVNHQLVRNRVLLFGIVSTAFDPSTPVDARTGRIQDNETTIGYEGGVKGRTRTGRLDYSASAFLLYNRNIARRNPLYDDPVFDANQTQPQLVASGEERFAGFRAEVRHKLSATLNVAFRGVHLEAITTKSPALGPEVGRQLARLPENTATAQLRYSPPKGAGVNWGAGLSYIGPYVGNYEDAKRAYLEFPGYGLLTLNTGYSWKRGPRQFNVGLSLRNALDRNLLASNARLGADRELGFTARVIF
jgi:iron complex outermembrane receptor protein